ncbi:MAG: hypothetical protein IH997_05525 [Proteobacteria bacterium]|nr:hypothetical protein [Pseudomonadota bacterium]
MAVLKRVLVCDLKDVFSSQPNLDKRLRPDGYPAKATACYNLAHGEPKELTGRLEYVIFAGPPNFEDVQRGDTPEPNFVLQLDHSICISGDDFSDPHRLFRVVQIVETKATAGQLRRLLHQTVTVSLTDQMGAETGHHHEPLVAWVTAVGVGGARPMDFVDEYGTAATTIRTFYTALGDGQGADASAMVVPEKRATSAFSPLGLTRFYGSLAQRIRLVDIAQSNANTYLVHYRYATTSRACDGKAVVTTTLRGGRNFIQGIKALNDC